MKELTPFTQQVIKLISQIPKGKVATYGQIAKLTGRPNASRGVVWILNSSSKTHKLPWHRVINSRGLIAFPKTSKNFKKQKKLLNREGIVVDSQGEIDLKAFQWKKKYPSAKAPSNKPQMFR